jgi:hypothetical protein
MNTSHTPASIEIEIDSLVLNGFHASDRYRISAAFEGELTRLINEQGLEAAHSGEVRLSALDAGSIQVRPGAPPAKIGAQIARAIYQRINTALKGNQHD